MRILLVGVFTPGSTNLYIRDALRSIGHDVTEFAYRDHAGPIVGFPLAQHDLVWVCKGSPLGRAEWRYLAQFGRHRLLWWMDPFENWTENHTYAVSVLGFRFTATGQVGNFQEEPRPKEFDLEVKAPPMEKKK